MKDRKVLILLAASTFLLLGLTLSCCTALRTTNSLKTASQEAPGAAIGIVVLPGHPLSTGLWPESRWQIYNACVRQILLTGDTADLWRCSI